MEYLPDLETLLTWLMLYGSIAIFALLALGIIALPVPEETLMIIAGVLMTKGQLPITQTYLAACGGSICGITISYLLGGTAGSYLIHKYGRRVGITETKLTKIHAWFEHYGTWVLFFGYFIPGVRHFTGLTAGISKLEFRRFALFAYTGAIVWASLFLSIGYFFGNHALSLFDSIEMKIDKSIAIIACLPLIASIFVYRKWVSVKSVPENVG